MLELLAEVEPGQAEDKHVLKRQQSVEAKAISHATAWPFQMFTQGCVISLVGIVCMRQGTVNYALSGLHLLGLLIQTQKAVNSRLTSSNWLQ